MFQPPVHQAMTDLIPWLIAALSIVAMALMATQILPKKKKEPEPEITELKAIQLPVVAERTLTDEEVSQARQKLRQLKTKRERVNYELTRLYESEAGGKSAKEEKSAFMSQYSSQMKSIDHEILRNELLIDLYTLKETRTGLYGIFQDRLSELDQKIEAIQSKLSIDLKESEPTLPETEEPTRESTLEEKEKTKEAPEKLRVRTKAEERLDEIRAEVDKELERLGQMETEV